MWFIKSQKNACHFSAFAELLFLLGELCKFSMKPYSKLYMEVALDTSQGPVISLCTFESQHLSCVELCRCFTVSLELVDELIDKKIKPKLNVRFTNPPLNTLWIKIKVWIVSSFLEFKQRPQDAIIPPPQPTLPSSPPSLLFPLINPTIPASSLCEFCTWQVHVELKFVDRRGFAWIYSDFFVELSGNSSSLMWYVEKLCAHVFAFLP